MHPDHKRAITELLRAADQNQLASLDCLDTTTNRIVPVLCAIRRTASGEYETTLLAQLFTSDPKKFLAPPPSFLANRMEIKT